MITTGMNRSYGTIKSEPRRWSTGNCAKQFPQAGNMNAEWTMGATRRPHRRRREKAGGRDRTDGHLITSEVLYH